MKITRIEYAPASSFEEIWQTRDQGYQNPALISEMPHTSHRLNKPSLIGMPDFFGPMMAAFAIALHAPRPGKLRVLDYGGAFGVHCIYLRDAFCEAFDASWFVVETPLYADYGNKYIQEPLIGYGTSIDQSPSELEVAYFSGVLQYIEDWREPLNHPKVKNSKFIIVARTPLGVEETPYLQHVWYGEKKVSYPGRIIIENDLFYLLSQTHELLLSWSLVHSMLGGEERDAPTTLWRLK